MDTKKMEVINEAVALIGDLIVDVERHGTFAELSNKIATIRSDLNSVKTRAENSTRTIWGDDDQGGLVERVDNHDEQIAELFAEFACDTIGEVDHEGSGPIPEGRPTINARINALEDVAHTPTEKGVSIDDLDQELQGRIRTIESVQDELLEKVARDSASPYGLEEVRERLDTLEKILGKGVFTKADAAEVPVAALEVGDCVMVDGRKLILASKYLGNSPVLVLEEV